MCTRIFSKRAAWPTNRSLLHLTNRTVVREHKMRSIRSNILVCLLWRWSGVWSVTRWCYFYRYYKKWF